MFEEIMPSGAKFKIVAYIQQKYNKNISSTATDP